MRRFLVLGAFLFTGLLPMLDPAPAAAAVRYVAAYGVDAGACGTSVAPCRSIGRAIERAVAGDRIIVGPGFYGDSDRNGQLTSPGDEGKDLACGCTVSITKTVTVESSAGAAATVIGAVPGGTAVQIVAPGVVFGGRDKGFTVRGATIGIDVQASDVVVQGNVVTGGDLGILAQRPASRVTVVGNVVTNTGFGCEILTDAATVSANVLESNQIAILVDSTSFVPLDLNPVIADNHIVNNVTGISVFSNNATVRHNVLTGNVGVGATLAGSGNVVTSNNFTHNGIQGDTFGGSNCGVIAYAGSVNAEKNFWGAAQGPGVGAADRACTYVGTIDAVPFLTRPLVISNQTGR